MATFAPVLQTQPQPTGQVGTVDMSGIGRALSNVASALAPPRGSEPTLAEQDRARDEFYMPAYQERLSAIQQVEDPTQRRLEWSALQREMAARGIDARAGVFGASAEAALGVTIEDYSQDPDQIAFEALSRSPEGQGQILSARAAVHAAGGDPNDNAAVMSQIRQDEAVAFDAERANRSWNAYGRRAYLDATRAYSERLLNTSVFLRDAGVQLTNEMVQQTYQDVERFFQTLNASVDPNFLQDDAVTAARAAVELTFAQHFDDIVNITGRRDETTILSPEQIRLADRVLAAYRHYATVDDAPGQDLANHMGLITSDLEANDLIRILEDLNGGTLGSFVTEQPRWMEEAGILSTNNLFEIEDAIRTANTPLSEVTTEETAALVSQRLTETFRERFSSLPEDATQEDFANFTSNALETLEGYDLSTVPTSANQREGLVNSAGSLATSLHGHLLFGEGNETNPYYSREMTTRITRDLNSALNLIQQYNPEAADAIRATAWSALGGMAANAEAAVQSLQTTNELRANGSVRVAIDPATTNVNRRNLQAIADRLFNGDILSLLNSRDGDRAALVRENPEFFAGLRDPQDPEGRTYGEQNRTDSFTLNSIFGDSTRSIDRTALENSLGARRAISGLATAQEMLMPNFVRRAMTASISGTGQTPADSGQTPVTDTQQPPEALSLADVNNQAVVPGAPVVQPPAAPEELPEVSAVQQPRTQLSTREQQQTYFGNVLGRVDPEFADGVTGLIMAAEEAGLSISINNSYRSPETQASLIASYWGNYDLERRGYSSAQWERDVAQYGPVEAGNRWEEIFNSTRRLSDGSAMRNWIGLPGRSQHQRGMAADLTYGDGRAIQFAHDNAERFGLHFPLGNENWHVEVIGSRDGRRRGPQDGPRAGVTPDAGGWQSMIPMQVTNEEGFIDRFNEVSSNLGVDPAWLSGIINFESGWDTTNVNQTSGATGLIQWMPSTARGLGTTVEALRNMSATEQLEYVEAYFRPYQGRMNSQEDMYLVTFFPHALGKDEDFVLGSDGVGASPATIARQNPIFDPDRNGEVRVGDILEVIRSNPRFGFAGGTGGGYGPSTTVQTGQGEGLERSPFPPERPSRGLDRSPIPPERPNQPQQQQNVDEQAPPLQQVFTNSGQTPADAGPARSLEDIAATNQPAGMGLGELEAIASRLTSLHGRNSEVVAVVNEILNSGSLTDAQIRDIIQATESLPRTQGRADVLAELYIIREGMRMDRASGRSQ